MSLAELKKHIKDHTEQKLYLFCGEEEYLKNYYFNQLKDAILADGFSDFNYDMFEGKKIATDQYDKAIEALPMMAKRKLILVKDSGCLKQTSEQVRNYWLKRLEDIPDYICLVFYESEIDKRSSLYKAISKIGNVVECSFLGEEEMVAWIGRGCAQEGKRIEKDAAMYVIECSDGSMNFVKREIEKLISYCKGDITLSEAKRIVSRHMERRVFEMIDAISQKKAQTVFFELSQLKELGENAFGVLALLFSHFEKLLHTRILMDEGIATPQLASKLGINPYIVKKYIAGAKVFDKRFLKFAASECAQIDFGVKQGLYDGWEAIEEFLAKCLIPERIL